MKELQAARAALAKDSQANQAKKPNSKVKATPPKPAPASAAKASHRDAEPAAGSAEGSEEENDENLSGAAKRARLRRVCERKSSGKLLVPESVHNLWKQGGHTRDELCEMLEDAGWNKDCIYASMPYDHMVCYLMKHIVIDLH